MSLPKTTYNSLLYTYKAAVLDNWHDFSTPYKFKPDQIADIIQPWYKPLEFENFEIPNTCTADSCNKPPLKAQTTIGEGVNRITSYGCPTTASESTAADRSGVQNATNEEVFLAQIGIIKDKRTDSETLGMKIIMIPMGECGRTGAAVEATSLASTDYIDFTAERLSHIKEDNTARAARMKKNEYNNISLGEEGSIGASAFGDLMEKICVDGEWKLVADTIQSGFQYQVGQYFNRKVHQNPEMQSSVEMVQPVPPERKNRLIWVDCAETAFDPAKKTYGPGEAGNTTATNAGAFLGLTKAGEDPNYTHKKRGTFIKTEKIANRAIIFPRFNTLSVSDGGVKIVDLSTFLPDGSAKKPPALSQTELAKLEIDRDQADKRAFFMTNCDITLTRISNKNNLLKGVMGWMKKQKGKVTGLIQTPDGGHYIANKSFCEIGKEPGGLIKGKGCGIFSFCYAAIKEALTPPKTPPISRSTPLTLKDKGEKFHLLCKRLGDAGIGLYCASNDKSILITGDGPLLGLAMMYGVDVIIFHNHVDRVNIHPEDYDKSISIFYNKRLQTFESKLESKKNLLNNLEAGIPKRWPSAAEGLWKKLREDFTSATIPYIGVLNSMIIYIQNIFQKRFKNLNELRHGLIKGNKIWRAILTFSSLQFVLIELYAKVLNESFEFKTLPQIPPAPPLTTASPLTPGDKKKILDSYDKRITFFKMWEQNLKAYVAFKRALVGYQKINFDSINPTVWDRAGGFLAFLERGSQEVPVDSQFLFDEWNRVTTPYSFEDQNIEQLASWRGLNSNPPRKFGGDVVEEGGFFFLGQGIKPGFQNDKIRSVIDGTIQELIRKDSGYKAKRTQPGARAAKEIEVGLPSDLFPIHSPLKRGSFPRSEPEENEVALKGLGGIPIFDLYINKLEDVISSIYGDPVADEISGYLNAFKKLRRTIISQTEFCWFQWEGDDKGAVATVRKYYAEWSNNLKIRNTSEVGEYKEDEDQSCDTMPPDIPSPGAMAVDDDAPVPLDTMAVGDGAPDIPVPLDTMEVDDAGRSGGAATPMVMVIYPFGRAETVKNYILTINFLRNAALSINSLVNKANIFKNIDHWDWESVKVETEFLPAAVTGNVTIKFLKKFLSGLQLDFIMSPSEMDPMKTVDWLPNSEPLKEALDTDFGANPSVPQNLSGPEELGMGPKLSREKFFIAPETLLSPDSNDENYLLLANTVRNFLFNLANTINYKSTYKKTTFGLVPTNMGEIITVIGNFIDILLINFFQRPAMQTLGGKEGMALQRIVVLAEGGLGSVGALYKSFIQDQAKAWMAEYNTKVGRQPPVRLSIPVASGVSRQMKLSAKVLGRTPPRTPPRPLRNIYPPNVTAKMKKRRPRIIRRPPPHPKWAAVRITGRRRRERDKENSESFTDPPRNRKRIKSGGGKNRRKTRKKHKRKKKTRRVKKRIKRLSKYRRRRKRKTRNKKR